MEDNIRQGRQVLQIEGKAILAVAERLGASFVDAVEMLLGCRGKVVLTGVGKAGLVARKISATLASTGTPSIYLHPVEALHGDLGRLDRGDVAVALSNSGASREILELLDHIKRRGVSLLALTGRDDGPLARNAEVALIYGPVEEACPLGVAPSVSTTCMLALGDALALTVMRRRDFQPQEYAAFHPGGSLGRQFLRVEEVMTARGNDTLSIARDDTTLDEALRAAESAGRRSGALLLVDANGCLSGILTDADLRRLLIAHPDGDLLRRPVAEMMTRNPKRTTPDSLASEAEAVMNRYRIDELPVVDSDGRPVGMLDVQDVLGVQTVK